MFSSRLSYYLRIAALAFLLLQLFRAFHKRGRSTPEYTSVGPSTDRRMHGKTDFLLRFDDDDELLKYSNVYFIETSAPFRPVVTIEARQACAIEAAARANPRKNVIVLLAAWIDFTDADLLRVPDLQRLLAFPNVHFRWLDLECFAQRTPVESVIKSERLYDRPDAPIYLSEILRFVLLYKYGGIYLDLDVVTLKPLEFYHPNFFGSQSWEFADTSVMGLQRGDYGEQFALDYLEDIQYFHDANHSRSGTALLTNRVLLACEKATLQEVVERGCFGRLEVFPHNLFHPFDESEVGALFNASQLAMVKHTIAESMAVHMHHQRSQSLTVDLNGETGYEMIARNYCPSVYEENEGNL